MLISSPRPYGPVPAGLLKDLGIDAKGLSAKYPNDPLYRSRNLGNATWFDKETFGADKLVKMPGGGHGESAGSREALTAALAQSPLPAQAQRDVVRLLFDKVDYLPGLSEADKRKRLTSMSYTRSEEGREGKEWERQV